MQTNSSLLPTLAPRDFAADMRARLDRLTEELATGRAFDTGRALQSDFSTFSRVTHDLRTFEAREEALSRARTWMDVAQTSLGAIDAAGNRLGEALTSGLAGTDPRTVSSLGIIAEGALEDIVTSLSRTDGGRSVFANGDASGTPPFDLEILRSETRAIAQAAPDLEALLLAFDGYFAPGGGVEASALSTFPAELTRFPIGGGEALSVPVSVRDQSIRDAVKQAALIAALPNAGFAVSQKDRSDLASELPRRSVAVSAGLAISRGQLGSVEARASSLSEEMNAERGQLEIRRSDAVATDPYETASRLQDEISRLETIYAVTARTSRLNLTDYLR